MIFQIRDDKGKWKLIREELVEGERGKEDIVSHHYFHFHSLHIVYGDIRKDDVIKHKR